MKSGVYMGPAGQLIVVKSILIQTKVMIWDQDPIYSGDYRWVLVDQNLEYLTQGWEYLGKL